MPRADDMTSSLHQSSFDQHVLSKFLKISPKVLGGLEILLGIGMLILTIWTGFFYLLWSCVISLLTGSVTVSAGCMRNICWVRIAQFINCFSAIVAAISIPFHCLDSDGVPLILLLVCDVLIFFVSVTISSSTCECCRTKSRQIPVSYMNRDVSYMTDYTVLQGSQSPFAPPPNYTENPSAAPPKYNEDPFPPPPKYDLYLSVNDNQSHPAPPPNYSPVSSQL